MKKIFAIALAAVMVLSMASAFAVSDCAVWGTNWPCTVDDNDFCGKAVVEVVPLVKVNTACGWEYQVNECAGAVRSTNVYFALKLTVDAYPDPAWFDAAVLEVEYSDNLTAVGTAAEAPEAFAGVDMEAKKEAVYYLLNDNTAWVDVEDWDDEDLYDPALTLKNFAFEATASEETPAFCETWGEYEVCATLVSYYDGAQVGDYEAEEVVYDKAGDYFYNFSDFTDLATTDIEDLADAKYSGDITIVAKNSRGVVVNKVVLTVVDGAIVNANWNFAEYDDNDKFYNKLMADFGFNSCGTAACVTDTNIQKNFGWNDEQEDCFKWSTKAAAVVDAECVVAIPKTGDASLLAWLF